MGSASSVFLAVTALSLVIASTRTAGRPDEDDGKSDFLEYPHDPVTDAELRTRRNPWSQVFPTDGNLHRNPRVIPQPGWGHLESLHPRRSQELATVEYAGSPVSRAGQRPGTLPDRGRRTEVRLPRDHEPGPHRHGTTTLVQPLEAALNAFEITFGGRLSA